MSTSIYLLEKKLLSSDRDRFFNCIIDSFFILVTIFLFTLIVVITGNLFQFDMYRMWWMQIMINLGFLGTYFSFSIFYYLVFEFFFGRTIGKFITGSVVVNENGLKPNFRIVCVRTLSRFIPFDALSFLTKSGRIWHDSISKTYVVEKKDLERDMEIFYSLNFIGAKEIN